MKKLHPTPEINPETEIFWQAANEERLLLKRCVETGKAFHPPRTFSPFSGLAKTEWIEASGNGTVYSFSVTMRNNIPHCIAYIELDEGPIILSILIECDFEQISIGQKVCVAFASCVNGQKVPVFTSVI